ncbi:amino acid ABC transporter substrate-binding protein [Simiduia agarivorans SA1 = DSM 21679]|uniref:Amino acid ABC transporter substrate-binding protein n=2 Tax=Simiduia TaxID=447467 RepID=K4KHS7_SIMAS|nr:amino acid ABC transporter substrate-binding protein [Simiduia agarivorans SA1 = DSM 21679]
MLINFNAKRQSQQSLAIYSGEVHCNETVMLAFRSLCTLISVCVALIAPLHAATGMAEPLPLNQLRYITEHSPPHNFVENGELQGPAVDLLLAATAKAGSPLNKSDILVQPWARGYRNALEGPNTVLFNTIRTESRETLFKWAGPTGTERYVIVAPRKNNLHIKTAAELSQYRIGAIRDDAGEYYLRELEIPKHVITLANNVNYLGKMLKAGRIDMWAFGEDGWQQALEDSGIDSKNYEVVYVLKTNDYYFAFSLDIDDKVVAAMQRGIDAVIEGRIKSSNDSKD